MLYWYFNSSEKPLLPLLKEKKKILIESERVFQFMYLKMVDILQEQIFPTKAVGTFTSTWYMSFTHCRYLKKVSKLLNSYTQHKLY